RARGAPALPRPGIPLHRRRTAHRPPHDGGADDRRKTPCSDVAAPPDLDPRATAGRAPSPDPGRAPRPPRPRRRNNATDWLENRRIVSQSVALFRGGGGRGRRDTRRSPAGDTLGG